MTTGTLVILNGTTSAGKSSTQRALMQRAHEPWLAAGVDYFWRFILDGPYAGFEPPADQGFQWIGHQEGEAFHVTDVYTGPVGYKFYTGMHRAIRAFLDVGLNVVADHCLWDQRLADECAEIFQGVNAWMVGLHPPLAVSEMWERQRTDKQAPGMSRTVQRLIDTTHVAYDLTFDTSTTPPEECANAILKAIESGWPQAFKHMYQARTTRQPHPPSRR